MAHRVLAPHEMGGSKRAAAVLAEVKRRMRDLGMTELQAHQSVAADVRDDRWNP